MRHSLGLLAAALLGLGGCTVTAWLEDAAPEAPVADDDSVDDADSVAADDSASPSCRLPVPDHVLLQNDVQGDTFVNFYVPTTGWALAALHGSQQLEELAQQQIDLRLSPSFFFALALETGTFGCTADLPADPLDASNRYPRRPETDLLGCLEIQQSTVWVELCRMYPGTLPCDPDMYEAVIPSTDQASTGRDNVEPGVLAVAWHAVYAYSMLQHPSGGGVADPDAWFAAATDPRALETLLGFIHWETPFHSALGDVTADCADAPVQDCLSGESWSVDRATAIGAHTADLDAAASTSCFDRPLTAALVDDYVDAIAVLFSQAEVEAGRAAAQLALTQAGGDGTSFQVAADSVLDALDEGLGIRLRCPGSNLNDYYGLGCPP